MKPRAAFGYSERKANWEHRQRKTKTSHWLRSPGSPSLLVDMARQLSNGSWKCTVVRRRLVAQTGSGEEALSPKRTHPNHYNRYTSPSSYAPLKTINWLESWLPCSRCFAGSYERFALLCFSSQTRPLICLPNPFTRNCPFALPHQFWTRQRLSVPTISLDPERLETQTYPVQLGPSGISSWVPCIRQRAGAS